MNNIPPEKIQAAAQGLHAIAHELRLAVLCHLLDGPMCVGDLIAATGTSQSNLSQHLAKMRMLGMLATEKRGQRVYYRLTDSKWSDVLKALQCIYCPEMAQAEKHTHPKGAIA